ncbi:RimL Acetyltransferases, including N-acetylases of ribosomal proteins [Candidatus Nanopelagicaceae bacterium]
MYERPIKTERLELHHIPAEGIIALLQEKNDLPAIAGRDFSNPHKNLVLDSGPLPWRVPQVKADPSTNKWFVRFIVDAKPREVIGSTSFHGVPDSEGMMEIGIGIEEAFWGNGYATEALLGMWKWVCGEAGVRTLRYTVSPSNLASVAIIKKFEFTYMGQQIDEEDGPEDIYEMSVDEFKSKWGSTNE